MLKINFIPMNCNHVGGKQLELSWTNMILTVNNGLNANGSIVESASFDLSLIPDSATVEHEVLKIVERMGDDYEVTLILPHGANAPESTRFPVPLETSKDGPLDVPVYDVVLEVEEVIDELA